MNGAASGPSPLDEFVRPILGLPAWGARQGYGSFLTFEFGEPKLEVVERRSEKARLRRSAYVQGEWHLWIYSCHWRTMQDGKQIAWSEDPDEIIGRAAARLNGQKLLAVKVDPTKGGSTFIFDLGGSLETWPYGDDPEEKQWIILTKTEAFGYRADGFCARDPSDTPPDQERWARLR